VEIEQIAHDLEDLIVDSRYEQAIFYQNPTHLTQNYLSDSKQYTFSSLMQFEKTNSSLFPVKMKETTKIRVNGPQITSKQIKSLPLGFFNIFTIKVWLSH
jgi:hypothetical protein